MGKIPLWLKVSAGAILALLLFGAARWMIWLDRVVLWLDWVS